MRKVDTLVIDKTGTLTLGKPKLTTVKIFGTFDEYNFLRMASSLEQPVSTLWLMRLSREQKKKIFRKLK